jgi:hypothetical protein
LLSFNKSSASSTGSSLPSSGSTHTQHPMPGSLSRSEMQNFQL